MEKLGQAGMTQRERQVVCISQDSFYKELTPAERNKAVRGQLNFDHPGNQFLYLKKLIFAIRTIFLLTMISDAFNEEFMFETLKSILDGKICRIPVYDYKNYSL